jgi:hypothetical protein
VLLREVKFIALKIGGNLLTRFLCESIMNFGGCENIFESFYKKLKDFYGKFLKVSQLYFSQKFLLTKKFLKDFSNFSKNSYKKFMRAF